LDEIEQSKRVALERYKADELRKLAHDRDKMRLEREAHERERQGFREPHDGMMG